MILVIRGMACLGSFGPRAEELWQKALLGQQLEHAGAYGEKGSFALSGDAENGRAVAADTSKLKDFFPARGLRQLDHFTRMALLCAAQALQDAGTGAAKDEAPTGVVLSSGYGPAAQTFDFLDSILAHGERMASPLSFSHSVQNIPAASIAAKLDLVGPCATFCQLDAPVAAGLAAARQWLDEERVEQVLFGAVDEHTPFLARIAEQLRKRKNPGRDPRASVPLGEGAAFFCLAKGSGGKRRGEISRVTLERTPPARALRAATGGRGQPRIFVSGAAFPQKDYPQARSLHRIYGKIPIAQALDVAVSLAPLKESSPAAPESPEALCLSLGPQGTVSCIHTRKSPSE